MHTLIQLFIKFDHTMWDRNKAYRSDRTLPLGLRPHLKITVVCLLYLDLKFKFNLFSLI